MTDIFDATILCKICKEEMHPIIITKEGTQLRAIECKTCNEKIIHPADLNCLENFKNLKGKTYNVKLRIVGNSHAISIPKEIVNFMKEQEKLMDHMVRLSFDDMRRLSLRFGNLDHTKRFR
jgi:DNA-directed RNA polymerase subunit RPC12/RpoP